MYFSQVHCFALANICAIVIDGPGERLFSAEYCQVIFDFIRFAILPKLSERSKIIPAKHEFRNKGEEEPSDIPTLLFLLRVSFKSPGKSPVMRNRKCRPAFDAVSMIMNKLPTNRRSPIMAYQVELLNVKGICNVDNILTNRCNRIIFHPFGAGMLTVPAHIRGYAKESARCK